MKEFIKILKEKTDYNLDHWNEDYFDWENDSRILPKYCSDYFNVWWNEDKFDWLYSNYLAKYCYNHFDTWWDFEKYDWRDGSYCLSKYCYSHFDKWWNEDKFNRNRWYYLAQYCTNKFDKWWNPKRFNWRHVYVLARYCPNYLDKWLTTDIYKKYFYRQHNNPFNKQEEELIMEGRIEEAKILIMSIKQKENSMGLTKREMIKAMLEGEILTTTDDVKAIAYFDETKGEPFRYKTVKKDIDEPMEFSWYFNWKIQTHWTDLVNNQDAIVICKLWDEDEETITIDFVDKYIEEDGYPYKTDYTSFKNARPLTPQEAHNHIDQYVYAVLLKKGE